MLFVTENGIEELDRILKEKGDPDLGGLEGWILWYVYEHPGRTYKNTAFVGSVEGEGFSEALSECVVEDLIERGLLQDRNRGW